MAASPPHGSSELVEITQNPAQNRRVHTRALTLAIRLLSTTCATVALGSMTGCPFIFPGCGDETGWQEQEPIALGVDVDLEAVVRLDGNEGDRYWTNLAVGGGGTVVVWGETITESTNEPFVDHFVVGGAALRGAAVSGTGWWVVGDGGMLAVTETRGTMWTTIDLGINANFHAIASHMDMLVVVGDEVVIVRDLSGNWAEVPAPSGGWGQLRAVYSDGSRIYAVGLGGVVWSAADPLDAWVAEDVGVAGDLFGVHAHSADTTQIMIAGAQGTVVLGDSSGGWTTLDVGSTVDFIACSESTLLGADGVVTELTYEGEPRPVGTFPGARALRHESYDGLVTVGDAGAAVRVDYYECVGGRPFVVDGRPRTASLASLPEPSGVAMPGEHASRAAAAWAQAGLYEHASVASFARFALELLALGAPPELLRAVSRASTDELEHARLCFALAQRFAGTSVGAGPLALGEHVLARRGDPVATAIALFEEGCVNESIAACEAADAAERCSDAQVRAVLETLAVDERRHAAAAWAGLRWLIDTHGERVAAPLRARVAALALARARRDVEADESLAEFGLLPPSRRAQVQRRVLSELVRPLALALVGSGPIVPDTHV
jgi:hypothetical protein